MWLLKIWTKLWLGVTGVFAEVCDPWVTLLHGFSLKGRKKTQPTTQKTPTQPWSYTRDWHQDHLHPKWLFTASLGRNFVTVNLSVTPFPALSGYRNWFIKASSFSFNKHLAFWPAKTALQVWTIIKERSKFFTHRTITLPQPWHPSKLCQPESWCNFRFIILGSLSGHISYFPAHRREQHFRTYYSKEKHKNPIPQWTSNSSAQEWRWV